MHRYLSLLLLSLCLIFAQNEKNDCFSGPIDSDGRPNGFGSIKVPVQCYFWVPDLVIETEWINGVSRDYFRFTEVRLQGGGGRELEKDKIIITKLIMSDNCWSQNEYQTGCTDPNGGIVVNLNKESIYFGETVGPGIPMGFGILYGPSGVYSHLKNNTNIGQFSIATVKEWITNEDPNGLFNPINLNTMFDSLRTRFPDMDFETEYYQLTDLGFSDYIYYLSNRYPAISTITKQKTLQNIAVVDFTGNNVSEGDCRALTDRLSRELFETKSFQVIEREMMDEIMEEQKFQYSGCVTDVCIVELGQIIGVGKIVGGSISKVGNIFSVTARIINVQSGKIENTAVYDHDGDIGTLLINGMERLANDLVEQ